MATAIRKGSPEGEMGGRSMIMPIPNPRRSPPRSQNGGASLHNGRKRQKWSHSSELESDIPTFREIGDEVPQSTRVAVSQESGSSDQSASKWFEAAAHDATSAPKQTAELDDDPPFYMSNRAPYNPTNFVASNSDPRFGGAGLSRLDSENEDLRGVIDDLTIENKKLKQMIKSKHRNSQASSSDVSQKQDRLFEVRMHGLPADKRKELEDLLKSFATSIHSSAPSEKIAQSKTSGSRASLSRNLATRTTPTTDSGYASLSVSGKGPASPHDMTHKPSTTRNVQSYLKDIPDTLLPQRRPRMTERAKQALIVRRLEQLFTGRAAFGQHEQPTQQQEISHSAARADILQDAKDNKKRKAEGNREARIMPPDAGVNLDAYDPHESQESSRRDLASEIINRPGSPDQRPTRPLDLDIHRAQIAADNIAYLDHLGLSAPKLGGPPRDGESSWMYLNLLTGLAQMHTLNVTPVQIQKAIKKFSKRLELSKDGGRVRWIGGNGVTRFPAEDEKAIDIADTTMHEAVDDSGTNGSSSKRSNTNSTSNAANTSNTPSEDKTSALQTSNYSKNPQLTSETSNLQSSVDPTKQTTATTTSSAFDYKPIVYRRMLQIESDEEMRDSIESYDSPSADSSSLAHAFSQSNLTGRGKEEGLITFFNNPYFCSDFSRDRDPSNMLSTHRVATNQILGLPVLVEGPESPLRHHDATYFTTQFAPKPFDLNTLSASQKETFEKSLPTIPELQPIVEAGEAETQPLEFPVCGLGGITPLDNFVLDVKVLRRPAPTRGADAIVETLPFSRRRYLKKYRTNLVSCKQIDLLPSRLPSPSYIFFTSSSSSENIGMDDEDGSQDDDSASDGSSSPMIDEQFPTPPSFLQHFSGNSGETMEDEESSEIDMLALARKDYPKEIAEQERAYILNQPAGVVRAVAGSLAATVGTSRMSSSVHNDPTADSVHTNIGGDDDDDDDNDMSDS